MLRQLKLTYHIRTIKNVVEDPEQSVRQYLKDIIKGYVMYYAGIILFSLAAFYILGFTSWVVNPLDIFRVLFWVLLAVVVLAVAWIAYLYKLAKAAWEDMSENSQEAEAIDVSYTQS